MEIIAFTGAGISKASGIPTFEEQPELRDKLSRWYVDNHREKYITLINELNNTCLNCQPNDAHLALAEYNASIMTMNIYGV